MSHSTRSSDRARLTFVMLCIMAFVMYIDRANISVAAPLIRKELGLTNTSLGLTFSAFGIAYAVFMIPGGWLSDRIGARKGLLVWGIVWSIATIATFTNSPAEMHRSTSSGLTVTKICGASASKATAITPDPSAELISLT